MYEYKNRFKKLLLWSSISPLIGEFNEAPKGNAVSNIRFSIQNQQEIRLSQISVAITAGLFGMIPIMTSY